MKKFLSLILLAFCAVVFVGCSSNLDFLKDLTKYTMSIEVDTNTNQLFANQKVDYVNKTGQVLKNIKFHLYANAFREGAKSKVVSEANKTQAYPNGESFGNIEVLEVGINNQTANFEICGEDENILNVVLFEELFPDDKICIDMKYNVTLANINHRLGYGENTINLCNFYPIACVYENGDFMCKSYNSNGDPFYSEVGDYDVTIKYPKSYILASSGNQTESKVDDEICTTNIKANCIRDFAIVLSQKFKHEKVDEDLQINYYYYNDDNPNESISLIKKVFQFFQDKVGKYPYKQISVVESNFVHGGMEYPNIVLISDNLTDRQTFELVIIHELCHQWFYGLVGNNEFDYGWIDEGLTEFCTVYFFDNHQEYGRTMENMLTAATMSYKTFAKIYSDVQGEVDTSMNRALDQFNTEPEYVYNTYVKGMLMFSTIYQIVGQKHFDKALKYYFDKNVYKNATPNDVINCFSKGSGKNLENLFNSWINGKVKII